MLWIGRVVQINGYGGTMALGGKKKFGQPRSELGDRERGPEKVEQ